MSHLLRIAVIEKIRDYKHWQGCREKGTLVHCSWDCELVIATVENNVKIPQRITRTIIWSSSSAAGNICRGNKNTMLKRYLHAHVLRALCTIAKTWKQPECPLMNEWIKMLWEYTHTHMNKSAIKIEGNPTICNNMDGSWGHYTKWNKSEKGKYCMISHVRSKKQTQ